MPAKRPVRAGGEGERNFLNSPTRDAGARTGARRSLLPPYQLIPLLYQPYPLPYQLYPVTYQLYLRPATADTRKSRTTFWKVLRLFHRYSCLSAGIACPVTGYSCVCCLLAVYRFSKCFACSSSISTNTFPMTPIVTGRFVPL